MRRPRCWSAPRLSYEIIMVALSEKTLELVKKFYPLEQQKTVIQLLENECADNLPFLEKESSAGLERFCFAVLKIGKSNFKKFQQALELANQDWRDLLVAAKFANSKKAHLEWARKKYGIG